MRVRGCCTRVLHPREQHLFKTKLHPRARKGIPSLVERAIHKVYIQHRTHERNIRGVMLKKANSTSHPTGVTQITRKIDFLRCLLAVS